MAKLQIEHVQRSGCGEASHVSLGKHQICLWGSTKGGEMRSSRWVQ